MVSKIWFRSLVICAVGALWAMPAIAQKGGQNPVKVPLIATSQLHTDQIERCQIVISGTLNELAPIG